MPALCARGGLAALRRAGKAAVRRPRARRMRQAVISVGLPACTVIPKACTAMRPGPGGAPLL